jgi:hypothetical protein
MKLAIILSRAKKMAAIVAPGTSEERGFLVRTRTTYRNVA